MPKPATPDQHCSLWDAFRNGDRVAFSQLYDYFATDLYRYGYNLVRNRQVVEDCLHELYLHLHESRQRLGPTDNIQFYLYRALRRRLLDTVAKLNKFNSDEYEFDHADFQVMPFENQWVEEELVAHQNRLLVNELNRLPKRQKEVLYLVYMKKLSHQQTAEVMGLAIKSVYNTLNVALTTMRVQVRQSFEQGGVVWGLLGAVWSSL